VSTFEVTYRAETGRAPERIHARAHAVDESTTPPTHRFEIRGRIQSSHWIERTGVESVRELGAEPPAVSADPRAPFARQVSNREFPQGRRP
jgi:hypothetical protein